MDRPTILPDILDISQQVQFRLKFERLSYGHGLVFSIACHGLAIGRVTGNLSWLPRRCQSNAEIGMILGITPATVGKHLERIYPKLGVENRTAAASFASEFSRNER